MARENDAIGSDGDTCLIKLVVREIERAVGQNRSPWRDQPGLVEHAESTPFSGRMKGTPIITFPLRREDAKSLGVNDADMLFFKRDEIDGLTLSRTRSLFSAIFMKKLFACIKRVSVNNVTLSHLIAKTQPVLIDKKNYFVNLILDRKE